jgi:hypothetical protein
MMVAALTPPGKTVGSDLIEAPSYWRAIFHADEYHPIALPLTYQIVRRAAERVDPYNSPDSLRPIKPANGGAIPVVRSSQRGAPWSVPGTTVEASLHPEG